MNYQIEWKEDAFKELERLESCVSKRIYLKVESLAKNPFFGDVKRLKGSKDLRLRVGDYRVIFDVQGDKIIILKVGHRKNIYGR